MSDFQSVIPILNVKNFAASMDYLNKLGFRKKWDWGDPPTFGCIARGTVEILFCEGAQGQTGRVGVHFYGGRGQTARGIQEERSDHPPATHEHVLGCGKLMQRAPTATAFAWPAKQLAPPTWMGWSDSRELEQFGT
jgi:hypothetical protein